MPQNWKPLLVPAVGCLIWSLWVVWRNPPRTWFERFEKDSPSGYVTVPRLRVVVFDILGGWLGILFLWALVESALRALGH
jgi:hypothetical protein